MAEPKRTESTALTAVAVGELVPQPHGGALRRGGTNRGGPGRPSAAFKRACTAALRKGKGVAVVAGIMSGDILEQLGTRKDGAPIIGPTRNADRLHAFETLAANAHGLPTQAIEQATDITIRIVRE